MVSYLTAEENLVTVMGGAVAVAAAIIGAASLQNAPAAPAFTEEELSGKGLEQAPRIGGRQKKKVKMSKPVLPKKVKEEAKGKQRWDNSDSSEEEEVAPAPAPAPKPAKGKKGKKGKKAAAAEDVPEEEAWDVVPKKVRKVKPSASLASSVVGGKTVIDLGDSKSAVIGKGGSVIKGIQVRPPPSHARAAAGCSLTLASRAGRRHLALRSTSRRPAPPAPSAAPRTRCAANHL